MQEQLWINVEYIARLIKRFNLATGKLTPESLPMQRTVVPVTSADELLREWGFEHLGSFARTAVAGTGQVLAYENTTKYRIHLRAIALMAASGDGTLDGLFTGTTTSLTCRIFTQVAAAHLQTDILAQDIILDQGEKLFARVAAISTDTVWNIYVYRSREPSF